MTSLRCCACAAPAPPGGASGAPRARPPLLQAHLRGGQLVRCLPDDNQEGIWEGKWARNRFVPYLCIGPEVGGHGMQRR